MYYIEFRAEGQALKRVDDQIVASDSKGFLYAKFDIDAGWDGLALEAVFEQNGNKYVQVLDEGLCPVPVEVLNAGRFKVWLTGVDSNTVTRATTASLTIDVLRGPGDNAVNASDPTPTEREQILTIASDAQRIAQSVRKDADEGKFNGKDGKVDEDIVNKIIAKYLADNKITGEVDPEKIKEIIEDYLAENPPEAGVDADKVNELIGEALKKYTPTIDEKDPTVPAWAKAETKPTYTASEVGADPEGAASSAVIAHNSSSTSHSIMRKQIKGLEDGKADRTELPTLSDLGGITPASVESMVSAHNVNGEAHNDLRLALSELNNRLNAIADSEDVDLNQLSEIVDYIKSNKTLIDAITTGKVSVSDIVDNLTTNVTNKPLSAAQGVALKALIDAIIVPTKLSDLTGDSSHRTVTDAEKSTWNAKSDFSGAYRDLTGKPTNVSEFNNDAEYVNKQTFEKAIEEATSVTDILENLAMLPQGGSKEWLEKNGDKTQLYQIGGYVWGYIESNGWTRSDTQFLVVSSESQMTNEGGMQYLLRDGDEGTVYEYTEASGDFDTPVYDSLPETANNGDIVAVGNKKYKASVGTKEVPDYTNLFDYDTMTTDANLNKRVSSSGLASQAGYFGVIGLPVVVNAGDTVTIRTKGAPKQTSAQSYCRILLYDTNGSRSPSTTTTNIGASFTATDEGDGVYAYSKTIEDENTELQISLYISSSSINANDVKDLIITFNEEIKTKTETTITWENIGTYTPPVEAGWSATDETYSMIDSLSATANSGDASVYSGDGYVYTYVSGSAWMQMSKYDKPSLVTDTELSDTSPNAVQNKVIKAAFDDVVRKTDKNKDDITALNEQVANLAVGSETITIPSFWKDAVDACIAKIKALQVGISCLTFPFFSDNHQRNGYAGMLIAYIMKECNIPYCFYGGDSISSGYIADEDTMIEQEKKFKTAMSYIPNGRFCRAVGNHDGYWYDGTNKYYYTDAQIYDLFLREESIAQNKHFSGDGTYYYVDEISSKVRFVVLDTNDGTVETEQLTWLENTALSFNESGWAVVLVSHQPLSNHYHALINNAEAIRTIIRNYINSTDANKASIVGCFSGHIHRDRIYTGAATNTSGDAQGTAMGFTQVTITSDNTSIAYDDTTKYPVANDDKSHAIDFVTINKVTRTVNLTRLGIGNDRSYNY